MTRSGRALFVLLTLAVARQALGLELGPSERSFYLESFGGLGADLSGIHLVSMDPGQDGLSTDQALMNALEPLCSDRSMRLVLRYHPDEHNQKVADQVRRFLGAFGLEAHRIVLLPIPYDGEGKDATGLVQVTLVPGPSETFSTAMVQALHAVEAPQ